MTFQVHVKTGQRVNDEFTNSYGQLWVGREGQPSQLVMNWGPYNLTAGNLVDDQRFGKIWLLPYQTNKDPNSVNPIAYTWYDELIISRNLIADPATGSTVAAPAPADVAPPVITGVAASSITTGGATIKWTTDEPADSQVE